MRNYGRVKVTDRNLVLLRDDLLLALFFKEGGLAFSNSFPNYVDCSTKTIIGVVQRFDKIVSVIVQVSLQLYCLASYVLIFAAGNTIISMVVITDCNIAALQVLLGILIYQGHVLKYREF